MSHNLLTHPFTYANWYLSRRQLASVIWNQNPKITAIATVCLQRWIAFWNAQCCWIDKPNFSRCSWTNDHLIKPLAELTDWEATVLVVMTSHDDLGESVKRTRQYKLIRNGVCLSDVDNDEWTHYMCRCQRIENTLHVVQRLVTRVVLGQHATVTCTSDAESRPLFMKMMSFKVAKSRKQWLQKSWNHVEQHVASCVKIQRDFMVGELSRETGSWDYTAMESRKFYYCFRPCFCHTFSAHLTATRFICTRRGNNHIGCVSMTSVTAHISG